MHNYVVKCLANTWLYGYLCVQDIYKQSYVLYKANIREDKCMYTEIKYIASYIHQAYLHGLLVLKCNC